MSITTMGDTWVAECSRCEITEEFDRSALGDLNQEYFMEMINSLKEDGWTIFKDSSGYWQHICPECTNG